MRARTLLARVLLLVLVLVLVLALSRAAVAPGSEPAPEARVIGPGDALPPPDPTVELPAGYRVDSAEQGSADARLEAPGPQPVAVRVAPRCDGVLDVRYALRR